METLRIPVQKTEKSKQKTFDYDDFVFGVHPTDHIFLCEYKNGSWENPGIEPFRNLVLNPTSLCFHYGQTVFEGMKAFRQDDGRVHIFRPEKHHRRFNRSLERMCMPLVGKELFFNALEELIGMEQCWLPENRDTSLYIRPFVIATEARLGVKVSEEYLFCITCTPMDTYYAKPVKVKVETEYVRAAEGGTGYAKCGGNYGAAFYPAQKAKEQGFDQVIWTDAKSHEFLEESGTMNMMIFMKGKLITPKLSSSILDGVTRDSIIRIAKDLGYEVEERMINYRELEEELKSGNHVELFGAGTAAVVSPVSCVRIGEKDYHPFIEENAVMFRLKKELEDIRKGRAEDKYNWNHFID